MLRILGIMALLVPLQVLAEGTDSDDTTEAHVLRSYDPKKVHSKPSDEPDAPVTHVETDHSARIVHSTSYRTLVANHCTTPGLWALTFDDGPSWNYPRLLDILKSEGVKLGLKDGIKATFFVVGERLKDRKLLGYAERAKDEGHVIANHSWNHPMMTTLGADRAEHQIVATEDEITHLVGPHNLLFRPPYGDLNSSVAALLQDYKIVMWNVDTMDYKNTCDTSCGVRQAISAVASADPSTSSFISLEHDMHNKSLEEVVQIIHLAHDHGYQFATIPDCFGMQTYRSTLSGG